MSNFYVYSLIDPRTEEIFYIGKGKGKRVLEHFKEKESFSSNISKLGRIKAIQETGYEVKHTIIKDNLSEEAALTLEKLIIYRLGREVFNEGPLTNITPGGRWHKEASLFLNQNSIPSISFINDSFPEILPALDEFPYTAKEFTALNCPQNPSDNLLHVFDNTGAKLHDWTIDEFIQIFGLGHAIELINTLKVADLPIYSSHRVWSKTNYEKVPDTSRIPYQSGDEVDFSFVENVNKILKQKRSTCLSSLYPNGTVLAEIKTTNGEEEVELIYYFSNQNKKHHTRKVLGKLDGENCGWYENGILKEKSYYKKGKLISEHTFYQSGNPQMTQIFSEILDGYAVIQWYDNGQLKFESKEDGTSVSYSPNGILTSKSKRQDDVVTIWDYYDDGTVKKETKMYYIDKLLHGYEKSFYNTGELRREVDYTKGCKNKVIRNYKKSGELSTV